MPEKLDFKLNPSDSKNGHPLVVEGILIWNLPKRAWLFTSSPYTCKAQICSISEQASCWLPVILRNCCQLKPGTLCGNAASPVLTSVWIWCRRSLATCIYFTFVSPVHSSLLLVIITVSKYSSLLGWHWLPGFSCAGSLCIKLVQCPWQWRTGVALSLQPSVLCPGLTQMPCYYVCQFLIFSIVLSIPA